MNESYGFSYFFISYVFEVGKFIFDGFTKLLCSGDLENPGQLPVLQRLEGTYDWVSWSSVISSLLTFLRSRDSLSVSQSYYVWVTSRI